MTAGCTGLMIVILKKTELKELILRIATSSQLVSGQTPEGRGTLFILSQNCPQRMK